MEGGGWLDVVLAVSCKFLVAGFGKAARPYFWARRPKRILTCVSISWVGNKGMRNSWAGG